MEVNENQWWERSPGVSADGQAAHAELRGVDMGVGVSADGQAAHAELLGVQAKLASAQAKLARSRVVLANERRKSARQRKALQATRTNLATCRQQLAEKDFKRGKKRRYFSIVGGLTVAVRRTISHVGSCAES